MDTDVRYTVSERSESGHCCFDSTVVKQTSKGSETVAECFDLKDAQLIARLLQERHDAEVKFWTM